MKVLSITIISHKQLLQAVVNVDHLGKSHIIVVGDDLANYNNMKVSEIETSTSFLQAVDKAFAKHIEIISNPV